MRQHHRKQAAIKNTNDNEDYDLKDDKNKDYTDGGAGKSSTSSSSGFRGSVPPNPPAAASKSVDLFEQVMNINEWNPQLQNVLDLIQNSEVDMEKIGLNLLERVCLVEKLDKLVLLDDEIKVGILMHVVLCFVFRGGILMNGLGCFLEGRRCFWEGYDSFVELFCRREFF